MGFIIPIAPAPGIPVDPAPYIGCGGGAIGRDGAGKPDESKLATGGIAPIMGGGGGGLGPIPAIGPNPGTKPPTGGGGGGGI